MNVYWIPTILLSLCLSSAANMISSHNCKDKLRTFHVVRVSVNGTASVSCPNLTGKDQEEMRFHLYLGLVEVGNHTHDSAHNHNFTETVSPVGEGLGLRVNEQDHTVSFVLSGMTTERAGVYTCEGQPMYPPPIEKVQDETQTVVLVEAYQCQAGKTVGCVGSRVDGVPVWAWVLGFWITIIYGLAVTVIAFVIWLRLKRVKCSQSDYMNIKPKAPLRGPRKKQGVQHPIRMGRY
ncbi:T-cell-specific surface glycoprotein CD28 isoform X2 [Oncorhynchus keta]|uniref:T-cell-specific surface glycoprotein CD28 isoform X1 n=1 Tax=Oncorhynchus keta TaxID=8018 RepID=UPI0015F857A8|nr:T-cell-specific surface glycoprotein CD28 isoform X1 [Oncorhynchus keta]XP_046180315.1 T-cell-specific surface glycoprotein CD28-like isoform X2 [Oncorhynchus gorbuscha]XP_052344468.1 T-cell-specific surface glycoprotein CD28 isoform X2 [Oncorhynchus keta]